MFKIFCQTENLPRRGNLSVARSLAPGYNKIQRERVNCAISMKKQIITDTQSSRLIKVRNLQTNLINLTNKIHRENNLTLKLITNFTRNQKWISISTERGQ